MSTNWSDFKRGEEHFGKEEHQRETKNAQKRFRYLNGRRVEAVLSQRLLEPQKESMAGRGRRAFLETKQRAVKANLRSGIISEGQLETKNDVHSQQ